LTDAAGHLEQARRQYDPKRDPESALLYGLDFKAAGLTHLALSLFVLGYSDRALVLACEAVEHAERLAHFHSIGHALHWLSLVHVLRREPEPAIERAKRAMEVSEKHGLRMQYELAKVNWGAALINLGEISEGIAVIREFLTEADSMNIRIHRTFHLATLAIGAMGKQQWEEAANRLREALREVGATGERLYEAEIHRLRGECVLARDGVAEADQAQSCFLESLDVARSQCAKAWELRTATSFARLRQSQDNTREALALLAPIYNWFTEGFDTRDLREAKALLEELS